jgi:hypothetical protein
MQRAASCTVDVGSFVYTFINRADTGWIDFVRFNEDDPTGTKTITGKIGTKDKIITAQAGPLSCVKCANSQQKDATDIRLYFVASNKLVEARLVDVTSSPDLKTDLVVPVPNVATDDTFSIVGEANGMDNNLRAIDQSSYMSSGRTGASRLPYVVWQASGAPNVIRYAWATTTGWKNDKLKVKLLPAS